MVERQIARRGVTDARVLAAMRQAPRERFVPDKVREFAYEDSALPIEEHQTISQPFIVAAMIEAAELTPSDRVLEVGAGSGYAAAVMGRIARKVFAIERHPSLAELARRRLQSLGYDNVEIRTADGTLGWPEAAPFDAIIVSAGGPVIPGALEQQLAPGGRLVIPVGEDRSSQRLLKLTRTPQGFREEDLGPVAFVPLIGEEGWTPDGQPPGRRPRETRSWREPDLLPALIARDAEALDDIGHWGFAEPFDRFASAKVVLIGDASHGTSEFYRARAAITRRLIERHGFTIVAAEADWPDAAVLNRFVRGADAPQRSAHPPFSRFPTWMWRNAEVGDFVGWLREYNLQAEPERRAGVYGLDLYSLHSSIQAVLSYLDEVDPEAAKVARERYGCLTPWSHEPQRYGRMALSRGYAPCEGAVAAMLTDLLARRLDYAAHDGERFLDASQNARLVRDAEAYYRAMYYGSAESWNLRDQHMFDSLQQLLQAKPGGKAVVWAHNSHVGDARFTEMGAVREELNLGQLCRERYGDQAVLIGMGTHTGSVAAATDWDGPLEIKPVRPSLEGSIERMSHESGVRRFMLDLREGANDETRQHLLEPRLQRFIGVIYRPETERLSHYAEASLPRQFDAWVWFDETRAVTPLAGPHEAGEEETWPFGL